ncbi:SDR family oxidoreductase [Syntrophomonas curvata]
MNDYTGKVVALTGAGSGLGKEVADRFGAHGAKLSLVDYNEERIKTTEREFKEKGYDVIVFAFDCTDLDKVQEWARTTFLKYGHVDFLFNNVGITSPGRLWNIPLSDWKRTFDINVFAMVNGIHAFMPYFATTDREIHICNTASDAGLSINGLFAPYNASKSAVVSVSESLAFQCQTYYPHIKTHVWCPGASPTDICYGREQDLVDKSDPYYSSGEFRELDKILKDGIAAGYPVSEAIDGFFEEFEKDYFYIRPAKHEDHLIQYKIDRILDKQRPVPVHLR